MWQTITPSPIYVASYEEDTPSLVDNLIPRPTTEGRRDTSKTEGNKNMVDRKHLIVIRDEEDELESDWDSECSF